MLAPAARSARAQALDAEVLYQRGRTLLKQGDIPGACSAFAASLRLEQAVGTMLNLADCREREGKLASAWSTFLNAASLAARSGLRPQADEARRRAERLAPRLSYLTISVADGSRIEGLAITRGGEPVDEALWNQGIPVDGGKHVVVATAVGNQPVSIEVDVAGEGASVTAEIPRLKRIQDFAVAPVVGPPREEPADALDDEVPTDEPRRMTPLRWSAIGAAAVGAGTLTAGALLGMRASDRAARAREVCPTDPCNDPGALALSEQSGRDATRANVAFVTGSLLVAGGVVLWFVGAPRAPDDDRAARLVPVVQPGEASLVVRGRF